MFKQLIFYAIRTREMQRAYRIKYTCIYKARIGAKHNIRKSIIEKVIHTFYVHFSHRRLTRAAKNLVYNIKCLFDIGYNDIYHHYW